MYCSSCGKEVQPTDKFCAACGAAQIASGAVSADNGRAIGNQNVLKRDMKDLKGWQLLVLGILAIGIGAYLVGGAVGGLIEIAGLMFLLFSIPAFVREAKAYDKAHKQPSNR